eukprot:gene13612-4510_t
MSAVGSEAASMLEKALEEMDDIFKEAGQPTVYHSPRHHTGEIGNNMDSIRILIENFEVLLVENNYPSGIKRQEAEALFHLASKLSYFMLFIEDAVDHLHGQTREDILHELSNVKKEKEAFLLQIGQLSTDLENAQKQIELGINTSEGKQKENTKLGAELKTTAEAHDKKSTTQDESAIGLKKRLREKASEVNRLKLIVDDLKLSHEEKDNALSRIQIEIERLREENDYLKTSLEASQASKFEKSFNENHAVMNGIEDQKSEDGLDSDSVFQNTRSTSEPNLTRNYVKNVGIPANSAIAFSRVAQWKRAGPITQRSANNSNGRSFPVEQRRNVLGNSFATWTMEQINDWLEEEGLAAYIPAFTKAIARGDDVFKMNNQEIEKELGISLHIHQKKLTLALKSLQSLEPDYPGRLDHNWVARWLDDIGLPQYKGIFYENRVDGRILQNLTLDDLFHLKVYNTLHHVSLKRAIQCLRHQQFHPNYLKPCLTPQNDDRCNHVMLWTNSRVMDWLRSVDLAEYAPNLRGSGVHGALMILEPRFNAETLANLLAISQSKTLLRRHLQSQFETLLTESCLKQKHMTAKSPDFIPLNSSEKHKLRKKGPFGTLRRRKSELELDQCICPEDLDIPQCLSPPPALDPDDVFEFSDTLSSPAVSNEQSGSNEV